MHQGHDQPDDGDGDGEHEGGGESHGGSLTCYVSDCKPIMARDRGPDAEPPPALGTYGGGFLSHLGGSPQNAIDNVTRQREDWNPAHLMISSDLLERHTNGGDAK